MPRPIALLVFALPLAACSSGEVREGVVASHLRPCVGVSYDLCMQVTDVDDGVLDLFYEGIEGFDFIWGFEVTLRYQIEAVDDPPADGSSLRYVLDDVMAVREELPGAPFTATFSPEIIGESWFAADVTGVVSMVGTPVSCEQSLCDALVAAGTDIGTAFRVSFEHTGAVVPLRAAALELIP